MHTPHTLHPYSLQKREQLVCSSAKAHENSSGILLLTSDNPSNEEPIKNKARSQLKMFSAAAATRLATKRGASSLLSTSKSSKTPLTLAALARSAQGQSRNFLTKPDPEFLRAGLGMLKSNWKPIVGGLALGTGLVHIAWGNEDNFYDKRFILDCDPDDLADFYGSENFMVGNKQLLKTPFHSDPSTQSFCAKI